MDLQNHFPAFHDALLNAFRQDYELQQFVQFSLHKNIEQDFDGPRSKKVYDLIEWADGEGLADTLLVKALQKKPNNKKLRELTETIRKEVTISLDQDVEALKPYRSSEEVNPHAATVRAIEDLQPIRQLVSEQRITGHLQALVVSAPHLQSGQAIGDWIATLQKRLTAVCSLGRNGKHLGTGFLIGRDLVLTNGHVTDLTGITTAEVCFGYVYGTDRTKLIPYRVTAELAHSGPKDYDYSILRLTQAPGAAPVPLSATPRVLALREPVCVIGYPNGDPLGLSFGVVWDENSFMGRVAYTANTQHGSSGSPVFDANWELVALHHHGEDNMNNHGIPLRDILKDLQNRKLIHVLTYNH